MGVAERKFNYQIKSLMHFNYPYMDEPGDGMGDEIKQLEWEAAGDAKFVGTEIPIAESVAGTPYFGYRCLQTAGSSDYLSASVFNNYLHIKSAKNYEYEFFIRKTSSAAGNIVALLDNSDNELFAIKTTAADYIAVTSSELDNLSVQSTTALTLETWQHVRIRISEGTLTILLDGVSDYSGSVTGNVTGVASIRLGGFPGQLDEFMIRHAVSNNQVPTEPYRGYIETYGIGGDGHNGSLVLTSGTSYINTSYKISSIESTTKFTVNSLTEATNSVGIQGQAVAGDELMILKTQMVDGNLGPGESGLYCFRKILEVTSTSFTLETPVTGMSFTQEDLTNYAIEAILVPNYQSVSIESGATVSVVKYSELYGGLCVFRSRGNVSIAGKILPSGYGHMRRDYYVMSHNDLPERFIMASGGGVIILSDATVSAGSAARIGATWSGELGPGARTSSGRTVVHGNNSGAGYGGGGSRGKCPASSVSVGRGGAGGVGYSGGGGMIYPSSDTNPSYTNWDACTQGTKQGINVPGRDATIADNRTPRGVLLDRPIVRIPASTDGYYRPRGGYSGTNIMIICKKIIIDGAALSSGGEGGAAATTSTYATATGASGGGTGMCYLAYEECE